MATYNSPAHAEASSSSGTEPTASAGSDQVSALASAITLDGSGSSGGDTYSWALVRAPFGSSVTTGSLSSSSVSGPDFTPDLDGEYVWELTYSDSGSGLSDSDLVSVSIGDEIFGNYFNPLSATKVDSNGIENTAPVSTGSGWFQYAIDASTAYVAPNDMLIYYIPVTGITWADTFKYEIYIEAKNETATRLVGCAALTDAPTGLASANGLHFGLSEETANNYDYWARDITASVPGVASAIGDPPILYCYGIHSSSDRTFGQFIFYGLAENIMKKDIFQLH